MGLQIQFIDAPGGTRRETRRFQLREEGGSWFGPEVNLLPVKTLPLISRVEVQVTGTPEVVASRLQTGYFSKTFPKPVQLSEPKAWGSGRIPNANPLPHSAVCELRVTVGYFDAGTDGRPVGPERVVTEVCLLHSGPVPDRPPELVVRNRELQVLVGRAGSQAVEVRNAHDGEPKLALVYPDTVLAPDDPAGPRLAAVLSELKAALEAAVGRAPARSDTNPLAPEFRWPVEVRLPEAVKGAVAEVEGGLSVPVEVTYPKAKAARWLLKVEAESKVFPGWVVIDFGTTNSTVTVHDTWDLVPFEGLPEEQEAHLRGALLDWLRKDATEGLGKAGKPFEHEWSRWRGQTAQMLFGGSPDGLAEWLRGDTGPRLHELVAKLETNLRLLSNGFRRLAYGRLSGFYREALRVPSLRRFQLFPIKLDPDTRQETVASEIEITGVAVRPTNPDDRWPEIRMGRRAQQGRLEAIGRGDVPFEQIRQRFHPSPKRYFGGDEPDKTVEFDGRVDAVSVNQLMRAGWAQLMKFADAARKDEPRFSEGPFRRAVITYPTVAPPSVRQTIQKLLKDLNVADVRTDYDEAVASAIFYIMREYNNLSELGLESFKARSKIRTDNAWVQNVLVFDIGGGTTDVALIRLTLTEEPVFAPGEDRGAGGRYYRLTPQLLSATGHMQLGGELMTLRIFHLLKGLIADKLLALVQDGKLTCDPIKQILDGELREWARDKNRYKPGVIRELIESSNPDARPTQLTEALELAERIIPTRWEKSTENRAVLLQTFYTLWGYAEEAKIALGTKDAARRRDVFVLDQDKITALLEQAEVPFTLGSGRPGLEIRLAPAQMEKAIRKVVEEAVMIAVGALEPLPAGEVVDWLILSGQSCNLTLVDREIRQAFQRTNRFVWNPERVTFLPQYAKLSTAIGACYAENQRRNRFAPKDSKKELRRGINVLFFDINNLFSYLPCSFVIPLGGGDRMVFPAGQELFDLYGADDAANPRGFARSEVMNGALKITLYRQDYKNATKRAWGTFDGQDLVNRYGLTEHQLLNRVRVQFEIDHQLNVDVLLFRDDEDVPEPRYQFTGAETQLDLTAALPKAAERLAAARVQKPAAAGAAPAPALPPQPPQTLPPLFDPQGALQWSLGVGTPTGVARTVFEPGQALTAKVHAPGAGQPPVRAALSRDWAEEFMDDRTVVVWGSPPGASGWVPLGKLERPGERPVFRRRYRLTLDERGTLRLHPGEPRYLESTDPRCLVDQPGWVFRQPLPAGNDKTDGYRNPFNGKH